ncbi:alpha-amylase family glycosyl hydrolase [Nonomuraea salmonea]|uniref:alpha-amylase family glycosyl hydrolase n=1 Tax=Nonomuraea salmonea TaxID=46181 RepID=UPI0031E88541
MTDFYTVDPRLGTLGDFVEFMRTAHDRGLRVIADLVVNHTSDQHPWFVESRSSRESPLRDWYVWKDTPEPEPDQVVFPDKEDSVWEYDERTGQYYLHSFYRHQPDLNVSNPQVRDEITRILGFWMELGLSGFRVDAVPFLIDNVDPELADPHEFLADLRGVHDAAHGRVGSARRGEPGLQGADGVLRRRPGRPAHHVLRLRRHAEGVAVDGARRRAAAGGGAARAAGAAEGLPVGDVPAQPRRADARQAHRRRAAGGLRGVRA